MFDPVMPFLDQLQYEFVTGRSAIDAVKKNKKFISENPKKYVSSLFVDIIGAFHNVW